MEMTAQYAHRNKSSPFMSTGLLFPSFLFNLLASLLLDKVEMPHCQSRNTPHPNRIVRFLDDQEILVKKQQRREFRRAWKEMSENFFREEEQDLQKTSSSSSEEESLAASKLSGPSRPEPIKLDRPDHHGNHMQRNEKSNHRDESTNRKRSKSKNLFRGLKKVKQRIVNSFFFTKFISSSSSSSTSDKSVSVAPRNSV